MEDTNAPLEKIEQQLLWRAAVKNYDATKKLTSEQVTALTQAARLAPTSYGVQPIKLYVVSDQETKKQLHTAGFEQPQFTDASHIFVLAARETVTSEDVLEYVERTADQRSQSVESLDGFKKMLLQSISGKSEEQLHAWAKNQAYLVLGMMLAVAAQLQIDTTPMEGFSPGEFDEILGTKAEGFKSVVVLAAGFRSDDDEYSKLPKVRKTAAEFVNTVE